jgi:hypothetical protein
VGGIYVQEKTDPLLASTKGFAFTKETLEALCEQYFRDFFETIA